MNKEKAVVIVSGGSDSVTLLYDLHRQNLNLEVLSFNYGSKHNDIEIPFAKYHADKLGIKHFIININFNEWGFKSDLLKSGGAIPEGHYEEDSMKRTVIPFRNGIMLSIATGYAESLGANKVFFGSHKGDRAQYEDCREEFTQAMSLATLLGTKNRIKIISPYNTLMKWDIIKKGLEMKIKYEYTHSCYNAQTPPCGRCSTCIERIESFFRNNTPDPKYETTQEWDSAVSHMREVIYEFNKHH